MDGTDWDQKYGEKDQFWSGRPNPALMAQAAALTPGRALEVGCGEGADAIWLSQRGWHVTGLDVSQVALDRAAQAANDLHVDVTWVRSSIAEFGSHEPYDLVSVLYPALPPQTAVDALLRCVAPGGTLLVVSHAHVDPEGAHGHHQDAFLQVSGIAEHLNADWVVETFEQRPRIDPPTGTEHVHDEVLQARRLD